MSQTYKSSIQFKSNIYPVVAEQILHDEEFLHSLRDPVALREFKKKAYRHYPSRLQREIIDRGVGVECSFAEKGDLSWGTIVEDDVEKVVCLCENYCCSQFASCRPGVEISEIMAENESGYEVLREPAGELEEVICAQGDVLLDSLTEQFGLENETLAEVSIRDDGGCTSDKADSSPKEQVSTVGLEPEIMGLQAGKPECVAIDVPVPEQAAPDVEEIALIADGVSSSNGDSFAEHVSGRVSEVNIYGVEGRYDESQAQIVQARPDERLYVNAGPGSGKTHTLIERIKYLIEDYGVEPDSITVLSFTRAAVAVVQGRLKAAAERGEIHGVWQDVDVTTFDKLCTRILYFVAHESGDVNAEKNVSKLSYEQRIVKATRVIERDASLLEGCSHLIVDETQDLVGVRADLVESMLACIPEGCGFTLFGDRCQSVYEYQVKEGGTTPSEFYSSITKSHKPREVYLEKNYRQKPSYPLDLSSLRSALLSEDASESSRLISDAGLCLGMPSVPMRKLNGKDIARAESQGSMGILTRKNDEALEIESLLWKLGVPVVQGRSDAGDAISRCVADAFTMCEGQTISEEEFERLTSSRDPYGGGRVWRALMALEGINPEGDRLRISNVLSALQGAVLPQELSAQRENEGGVTVSTVHASKGREFDTVWVLAENLSDFAKADELEEKRVAYVGLTRGAGSVAVQCLDEHFLVGGKSSFYTCKMFNNDRYFRKKSGRGRRGGKPRVVNIEIRNKTDVDFAEFRNLGRVQEMLASKPMEGTPLRLVLSGSGDGACYRIVLQDDEEFTLGRMKRQFLDDYRRCAGDKDAECSSLPDAFDELYIDRVITCIGRAVPDATYDRTYDDMAVWYGFTIGGYAHRDDSQGY